MERRIVRLLDPEPKRVKSTEPVVRRKSKYRDPLANLPVSAPHIFPRETSIGAIRHHAEYLGMRFITKRLPDGLYVWRIK